MGCELHHAVVWLESENRRDGVGERWRQRVRDGVGRETQSKRAGRGRDKQRWDGGETDTVRDRVGERQGVRQGAGERETQ